MKSILLGIDAVKGRRVGEAGHEAVEKYVWITLAMSLPAKRGLSPLGNGPGGHWRWLSEGETSDLGLGNRCGGVVNTEQVGQTQYQGIGHGVSF